MLQSGNGIVRVESVSPSKNELDFLQASVPPCLLSGVKLEVFGVKLRCKIVECATRGDEYIGDRGGDVWITVRGYCWVVYRWL